VAAANTWSFGPRASRREVAVKVEFLWYGKQRCCAVYYNKLLASKQPLLTVHIHDAICLVKIKGKCTLITVIMLNWEIMIRCRHIINYRSGGGGMYVQAKFAP
jgi:hypothetical protein